MTSKGTGVGEHEEKEVKSREPEATETYTYGSIVGDRALASEVLVISRGAGRDQI